MNNYSEIAKVAILFAACALLGGIGGEVIATTSLQLTPIQFLLERLGSWQIVFPALLPFLGCLAGGGLAVWLVFRREVLDDLSVGGTITLFVLVVVGSLAIIVLTIQYGGGLGLAMAALGLVVLSALHFYVASLPEGIGWDKWEPRPAANLDPRAPSYSYILIGVALGIYLGVAIYFGGAAALVPTLTMLSVGIIIQVSLGIGSCLIVSEVVGREFGRLALASTKLAAIALFPPSVGLMLGLLIKSTTSDNASGFLSAEQISTVVGWSAVVFLHLILLQALFELEIFELFVTALVMSTITAASYLLLVRLFASAGFLDVFGTEAPGI